MFENDLFLAATLMLNDLQSTELGASLMSDVERDTYALGLGLERRLSDTWSMQAELVALIKIDEEDMIQYPTRDDSFVEFSLSYHF